MGENAVPRLFDDYDVATERYQVGTGEAWQRRLFELAQVRHGAEVTGQYRPRFAHVVTISQIPGIDLLQHFTQHKGAPLLPAERCELQQRSDYARDWLARFAPAKARFEVQATLPTQALDKLDDSQRNFLAALLTWLEAAQSPDGKAIHEEIMQLALQGQGSAGYAFRALYQLFLGRSSGPRAGELLAALEPDFVLTRLREAVKASA